MSNSLPGATEGAVVNSARLSHMQFGRGSRGSNPQQPNLSGRDATHQAVNDTRPPPERIADAAQTRLARATLTETTLNSLLPESSSRDQPKGAASGPSAFGMGNLWNRVLNWAHPQPPPEAPHFPGTDNLPPLVHGKGWVVLDDLSTRSHVDGLRRAFEYKSTQRAIVARRKGT